MMTSLESKINAAYQHGRMDFLAGAPCNPQVPPGFCIGLSEEQNKQIAESWADGWHNESLMLGDLPDGLPA